MKCTICGGEVILIPSAAERARKYGDHIASYYTSLFPTHTHCQLAKNKAAVIELIQRTKI